MKIVNTLDAHVLLDYANQVGKQTELKMRFFSAYFIEHKDVSDRNVLIQEAEAVGISAKQSKKALADQSIKNRVKAQIAQWQQMGVSGLPTVVFTKKVRLRGLSLKKHLSKYYWRLSSRKNNCLTLLFKHVDTKLAGAAVHSLKIKPLSVRVSKEGTFYKLF